MDPISAAVGIGSTVAGLFSAKKDRDAQKKALQLQQQQRQESLDYINRMVEQTQGQLFNLFPQIQQSQNMGTSLALNALGGSFQPMLDVYGRGNMAAQQTLLAGLPQIQNALLGRGVSMHGIQAQSVSPNVAALSGLVNPQMPSFAPITQGA